MDNANTPRSRLRSETRNKRLAFYESQASAKSSNNSVPKHASGAKSIERLQNGAAHNRALETNDLAVEVDSDADKTILDSARTSEILMETDRDFRLVLKERELRQTKRDLALREGIRSDPVQQKKANAGRCSPQWKSSEHDASLPKDTASNTLEDVHLVDCSVPEVLRILGLRADRRRRGLQRYQHLLNDDDECLEEGETEKTKNIKKENEEERRKEEILQKSVNFDSSGTKTAANITGRSNEFSDAFLSLSSYLQDENGQDIARRPFSDFTENLSDEKTRTVDASKWLESSSEQKYLQPTISFSAKEIYDRAREKGNSNEWLCQFIKSEATAVPTPSAVPERSRSPGPRAVRFDCPSSPTAECSGAAASRAFSEASQSFDGRSSASGVSCMSIGDVAKHLQDLGINPKLIGIDLSGPARKGENRKGKGKARRLVKVCPACKKCNAENVSWCLNCTAVLIGLEPQPLPRRHVRPKPQDSLSSNGFEDEEEEDEEEEEEEEKDNVSPMDSLVESSFDVSSGLPVDGTVKGNEVIVEKLFDRWDGNVTEDEETVSVSPTPRLETPGSIFDEVVTPLTSPMVPMSPPTPAAVWDPKKVDVAALIRDSRALVDHVPGPESPREASGIVPIPEVAVTPRPVRARSNGKEMLAMQSNDTTFSSISIATASVPDDRQLTPQLAQALHLDLISSVEEPSDKTLASARPEDIAVLDRAEVLAMRQTSAASGKPDSVPQLPLSWSPTSTERSDRRERSSGCTEILYQDPNYALPGNWDHSESSLSPSPESRPHGGARGGHRGSPRGGHRGSPRGGHRGGHRGGGRHRPNSAIHLQTQNSACTEPMPRRPFSSDHHGGYGNGGYQRHWRNSSTAWSDHHPSVLKKKPADVLVRESFEAQRRREKPPPAIARLQENGSVRRAHARPHPFAGTNNSQSCEPHADNNFRENGSSRRQHRHQYFSRGGAYPRSGAQSKPRDSAPQENGSARRPPSRSNTSPADSQNRSIEAAVQGDYSLIDVASSPIDFLTFPIGEDAEKREEKDGEDAESKAKATPSASPGNPMGLTSDAIRYLEQRGWNIAENSPWLYLADEVWLRILRFLSIEDLSSVAATCQRLHCVANDKSLWRHIVVKRRHEMKREALLQIGARCPVSLKLRQCRAADVTVQDTSIFFDLCGHSLRKLAFNGCNQGAFSEDQFILLAALYCPQLTTVDVSYAYGVRDSTVRALAESCASLESVKLNGAQKITDAAIQCLIDFHADSLHTLELYCCFGITSNSVRELGKKCSNLSHVCFGTCTRVSANALVNFAGHRREKLRHLDLRGLSCVLDSTIARIVAVCPKLESVAVANCSGISNLSIRALANSCPAMRKLDVCGCNQVGSDGAQELVRKCKFLEELDFSSTCVDHRTITCLARTYVPHLKTLRLNFCCNLKEDGLARLCESTKALKTLLLFGVRHVSPNFIQRLRLQHPRISIKSDDSVENNDQ